MTEKELLSIVETLKDFQNIILGYEIEVFKDHNNLQKNLKLEAYTRRTSRCFYKC